MDELPEAVAGVRWRRGRDGDLDAVAAVLAAADRVDEPAHVRTRSQVEQLLAGVDPRETVVLGERDGRRVAAGVRFRPGGGPVRLQGAVVPEARGAGIGRALLAAQIADAVAAVPDAPALGVRSVGPGGVARLAARTGFTAARVFLTLRRDLAAPIERAALAAPLRAVPLEPALDEALRLAKNEAFRDHWQGLADEPGEWRARTLGPRLRRELSRIAVGTDGRIAGFVVASQTPEHPGQLHVPLVGTVREHRGRGVARALLTDVLSAAKADGFTEVVLDVDADSPTGAVRVYDAVGFVEISRATVWNRPLRPS